MTKIYFLILSGAAVFFNGKQINAEAPQMGWEGVVCETSAGVLSLRSDVCTLNGEPVVFQIAKDTLFIVN